LITKIIILSFCGGLFCLDRVFIQAMISRPIIIAPFIGLLLNNPYTGLIIGSIVELFWMDHIPVGTYIPPNDSLVAVIATSIAILAGQTLGVTTPQLIAFSILITIPFGILAKYMEIAIIKSNDALSDQAIEDAKTVNIRGIEQKNYWGLIKVFLYIVIFLLISQSMLIPFTILIYPKFIQPVYSALSLTYYFLPLLGIAVAINTIKLRGAIPVFCALFLIMAVVLDYLHVL
jgi:mannose/fructose/N-acetylgalactosamine-specific phosphotransferase system component IIC